MTSFEIVALLVIGLLSGCLGGMLGVGGSVIMIPALAVVLGPNQHLYQASAMIVNVLVSVPATVQHWRAGAIRWDVAWRMLPVGVIFIVIGVYLSDLLDPRPLQQLFGVFLLYVVFMNALHLLRRNAQHTVPEPRTGWAASGLVGGIMGFTAGLLGVGGGGIAVPLLQRVCKLPLRQCIASSAAVMCLTAVVGAARKNATLGDHMNLDRECEYLTLSDSMLIALCIAPTAVAGAYIGGWLTHSLPLRWVRLAFILLMLWASGKMLGIY